MKLVNFGSLNIDRVYRVQAFVRPGQTILARDFSCCAGGKGLNQSLAAARAGAQVLHAGAIGEDGAMLQALLEESGADTSRLLHCTDAATGHAVIQVEEGGQNCILVWGGANRALTEEYVDSVLEVCEAGDVVLVQNETSCVKYILEQAAARGLRAAVNPSPIDPAWARFTAPQFTSAWGLAFSASSRASTSPVPMDCRMTLMPVASSKAGMTAFTSVSELGE